MPYFHSFLGIHYIYKNKNQKDNLFSYHKQEQDKRQHRKNTANFDLQTCGNLGMLCSFLKKLSGSTLALIFTNLSKLSCILMQSHPFFHHRGWISSWVFQVLSFSSIFCSILSLELGFSHSPTFFLEGSVPSFGSIGPLQMFLLDEHDSPQWYDIVYFEHKLSRLFFGLPQKASHQWREYSLFINP